MTALIWTLLLAPAQAQDSGDVFVTLVDGNSGAIYLDGNETGLETPATIKDVPVGQHQIQVRGDCMVANASVDVAPGRIARTELSMSAVGGFLMLDVSPAEAEVFLDGERVGTGPTLGIEADCGDHVLEATAEGLAPEKRTISVEMGSALNLSFDLQEAGFGTLSLMVEPVSAELFLDGKSVAVGPVEVDDVAKGEHTVGAILDGYEPLEERVTVRAGEVTRVDLTLTAAPGEGGTGTGDTEAQEDSEKPRKEKKAKKEKSGRGKRVLLGTASVLAAGAGGSLVAMSYYRYKTFYAGPNGIESCQTNACADSWATYYEDGIIRPKYLGYGLLAVGGVGLTATTILVIVTEDGTPVVGIQGRF